MKIIHVSMLVSLFIPSMFLCSDISTLQSAASVFLKAEKHYLALIPSNHKAMTAAERRRIQMMTVNDRKSVIEKYATAELVLEETTKSMGSSYTQEEINKIVKDAALKA